MLLALLLFQQDFTAAEPVRDPDGVVHVQVTSPFQAGPLEVRFLVPKKVSPASRLLFVLPVEPAGETRWGDGFHEVQKLGLHDALDLIVVAPSFSALPWYADHPTDAKRRDESFFVKAVVPLVDRLHPAPKRKRLLLGFSKSGWGALTLMLRHPDRFDAAYAWDSPLMKEKPDNYGMGPAFGTQENFEKYQVTRLLREKGEPLRVSKRVGLAGYGNFREPMRQARALFEELKIPCDWSDGPQRKHHWDSGWVEEAVRSLDAMTR